MIKTVILDDHLMVLEGVQSMLTEHPEVSLIASFSKTDKFLEFIKNEKVDVVLLDINLSDSNGLELCFKLKQEHPNISVIGLSNYDDTNFIKNMMKNGAKSYLLKNTTKKELITAIKTVYSGDNYLPEALKQKLLNESFGIISNSFIPKLSRREKEILNCIANELTNQEIADKLYISIKTVESHRKNLLQKLDARNTAGLIKEAFTKGLLS